MSLVSTIKVRSPYTEELQNVIRLLQHAVASVREMADDMAQSDGEAAADDMIGHEEGAIAEAVLLALQGTWVREIIAHCPRCGTMLNDDRDSECPSCKWTDCGHADCFANPALERACWERKRFEALKALDAAVSK